MSFIRAFILSTLAFSPVILLSGPLHAYQPARWSHIDPYVLGEKRNGPQSIRVLDQQNHVIKIARYDYRTNGLLRTENYIIPGGKTEGKTVYHYDGTGKLISEELTGPDGKLMNRRLYKYSGKKLMSTIAFDAMGNEIVRQNYTYAGERIEGGVEISGSDRNRFDIHYEDNRIKSVVVTTETGEVLSEVNYLYDSRGRLKERVKRQTNMHSICKYVYSGDRLQSYTYYNRGTDGWIFDKKIELEY